MYVAKFPTALCSLEKTPTQDILKFRQVTWDTPLAGPHGMLTMFEIRSYFIILISGFLSVFLYLKKKNKLHHFIKHCKSIAFSRLAEKNIRSNLHNINRMSRILFVKWRKNMLATASEKIWRELCFHRVKVASRAAKKKTLLLLMMMQDEQLPVSYERRINYHSCTGDAAIFNINANSLFSSILFNLFTTLLRHRHHQTRTCRIVGA